VTPDQARRLKCAARRAINANIVYATLEYGYRCPEEKAAATRALKRTEQDLARLIIKYTDKEVKGHEYGGRTET
jgi:hypothetical protein